MRHHAAGQLVEARPVSVSIGGIVPSELVAAATTVIVAGEVQRGERIVIDGIGVGAAQPTFEDACAVVGCRVEHEIDRELVRTPIPLEDAALEQVGTAVVVQRVLDECAARVRIKAVSGVVCCIRKVVERSGVRASEHLE